MTFKFKRKRLLLSEKNKNYKAIGYARATHNEYEYLEENSLNERKKEQLLRRKLSGNNLGGRPKISPLKESLVIRLRNEGYSYRSIRSQTGIALSTIRRVILEGELT